LQACSPKLPHPAGRTVPAGATLVCLTAN